MRVIYQVAVGGIPFCKAFPDLVGARGGCGLLFDLDEGVLKI